MRRIVYVSFASRPMDLQELFELLARSRSANTAREISGVLFYQDRCFLQCIEGPSTAIATLMERIRRDPRHLGVTTLVDQPVVAERLFGEWSMGFFHMAAVEPLAPEGLLSRDATLDAIINGAQQHDPAALLLRHYWAANARTLAKTVPPGRHAGRLHTTG